MISETKEKKGFPFSYFDLVLAIVLVMLVSLAIGVYWDAEKREREQPFFAVNLESAIVRELEQELPEKGDLLYGENREVIGIVVDVEYEEEESGARLKVQCRLYQEPTGKTMRLETETFLCSMEILSEEEEKGEEK